MSSYIVLNHSVVPEIFEHGQLQACVGYWMNMHDVGRIRILGAGCGLKGYASLVDVGSEAQLTEILEASPVSGIEDVRFYAVTPTVQHAEPVGTDPNRKARFLIIAEALAPLPEIADFDAAAAHWRELTQSNGAEVFAINDSGGFIILVDVADHEELMTILMSNPINMWGEYEVVALITPEAEEKILAHAGAI